jgi:hypothetical protein
MGWTYELRRGAPKGLTAGMAWQVVSLPMREDTEKLEVAIERPNQKKGS